jgi:hypothetical protein
MDDLEAKVFAVDADDTVVQRATATARRWARRGRTRGSAGGGW